MYRLYDGGDRVRNCGGVTDAPAVVDFWRWAFGNLNEDALKGLFAEWLVGKLMGLQLPLGGRNGGANSDLILSNGARIEVKSAAYWQSWKLYREDGTPLPLDQIEQRHWDRLSKPIRFQVRRTRDAVDRSGADPKLWSDLYVFAVQHEKDPVEWDILDLSQWRFYCLRQEQVLQLPQTFSEPRLAENARALKANELRAEATSILGTIEGTTEAGSSRFDSM